MLSFGIIAEWPCDQQVIENVLLGYFQNEAEEPAINFVQPLPGAHGSWTLVFEALKRGGAQEALRHNKYVIIHIDTDVQEEPGFDVNRRERGGELSIPERVDRVIERLRKEIDALKNALSPDSTPPGDSSTVDKTSYN